MSFNTVRNAQYGFRLVLDWAELSYKVILYILWFVADLLCPQYGSWARSHCFPIRTLPWVTIMLKH